MLYFRGKALNICMQFLSFHQLFLHCVKYSFSGKSQLYMYIDSININLKSNSLDFYKISIMCIGKLVPTFYPPTPLLYSPCKAFKTGWIQEKKIILRESNTVYKWSWAKKWWAKWPCIQWLLVSEHTSCPGLQNELSCFLEITPQ